MNEKEDKEKQPDIHQLGEDILDFYVSKVLEHRLPVVRRMIIANNPHVDPELVAATVNNEVNKYLPEFKYKANAVMLLVIDYLIAGRVDELRKFEVLFGDLLERTLLKQSDLERLLLTLRKKVLEMMSQKGDFSDT